MVWASEFRTTRKSARLREKLCDSLPPPLNPPPPVSILGPKNPPLPDIEKEKETVLLVAPEPFCVSGPSEARRNPAASFLSPP